MKQTEARFNLPGDYYVKVHSSISLPVVAVMWIIFPTFAFFPNAFDSVVNDNVGDFIENNRSGLIKLFNVQVWLHMIECIVAIQKCRRYAIAPSTTIKWIVNVGIHGILALRFLLWPDKSVERIKVH